MLDGFYQKRPQGSLKNIWLSPDKRLEMFPDVLKRIQWCDSKLWSAVWQPSWLVIKPPPPS